MRQLMFPLSLALCAWAGGALGQAAPKRRSLKELEANRAYWGAPPTIPHAVDAEAANRPQRCLSCHLESTYVGPFNAFSPPTPHPELGSCTQCHVPAATDQVFKTSTFVPRRPPSLTGGALATSPPPMPHPLHMRTNCRACHASAATPLEIATQHAERAACAQCHVPVEAEGGFTRASEAKP
jgi:cytochrome c-type protein NapB